MYHLFCWISDADIQHTSRAMDRSIFVWSVYFYLFESSMFSSLFLALCFSLFGPTSTMWRKARVYRPI